MRRRSSGRRTRAVPVSDAESEGLGVPPAVLQSRVMHGTGGDSRADPHVELTLNARCAPPTAPRRPAAGPSAAARSASQARRVSWTRRPRGSADPARVLSSVDVRVVMPSGRDRTPAASQARSAGCSRRRLRLVAVHGRPGLADAPVAQPAARVEPGFPVPVVWCHAGAGRAHRLVGGLPGQGG